MQVLRLFRQLSVHWALLATWISPATNFAGATVAAAALDFAIDFRHWPDRADKWTGDWTAN